MTDETDPDDGTDVSLRQALAGEVVAGQSFFEHAEGLPHLAAQSVGPLGPRQRRRTLAFVFDGHRFFRRHHGQRHQLSPVVRVQPAAARQTAHSTRQTGGGHGPPQAPSSGLPLTGSLRYALECAHARR